jgi:hypothetical protein
MSPWVKKVFTVIMPRLLLMSRPIYLCQGSCGDERKKKNQFYNGIDFGGYYEHTIIQLSSFLIRIYLFFLN